MGDKSSKALERDVHIPMRRLVGLVLAFVLCSTPAFAQIALVTGQQEITPTQTLGVGPGDQP